MSERGRPFEPGNTHGKGRPKGSPNKQSMELQQLLLAGSEEFMRDLIRDAIKGDPVALSLCMPRLIPRLEDAAELPVENPKKKPTVLVVTYVPPPKDPQAMLRKVLEQED